MPKLKVRGDRLTIAIPAALRFRILELTGRDGDEVAVTVENGRIVLTPAAAEPLPGELEALDEAEAELATGLTYRLDDVLDGLGRKAK